MTAVGSCSRLRRICESVICLPDSLIAIRSYIEPVFLWMFFYHVLLHDDEAIEWSFAFRARKSTADDVRADKIAPADHLIRQTYVGIRG